MIYTVTLNPALDYIVQVDYFQPGRVNRTSAEQIFPGGKGLNVSQVLKNLGHATTALGFAAGFTGAEIIRLAEEKGIITDFIRLSDGSSRINVKLRSTVPAEEADIPEGEGKTAGKLQKRDTETEINGLGPAPSAEETGKLLTKLDGLREGDILVLAGSIPRGMKADIYGDILKRFAGKSIRVVVDASGELLKQAIPGGPFLVKPNQHELGELFGVPIGNAKEAAIYAAKLREQGAENVLVSMGAQGALLAAADGHMYYANAPEGKVVNAVGAGDSMVAGFLSGFLYAGSYEKALAWGIAAGSASAFSGELTTKQETEKLLPAISVSMDAI